MSSKPNGTKMNDKNKEQKGGSKEEIKEFRKRNRRIGTRWRVYLHIRQR